MTISRTINTEKFQLIRIMNTLKRSTVKDSLTSPANLQGTNKEEVLEATVKGEFSVQGNMESTRVAKTNFGDSGGKKKNLTEATVKH